MLSILGMLIGILMPMVEYLSRFSHAKKVMIMREYESEVRLNEYSVAHLVE